MFPRLCINIFHFCIFSTFLFYILSFIACNNETSTEMIRANVSRKLFKLLFLSDAKGLFSVDVGVPSAFIHRVICLL